MSPAPGDGFSRPKHHVHGGARITVAVSFRLSFKDVDRGLPLVVRASVEVENTLGMGALDQVVIAHEVLLTSDGAIVPQQVHRVHVAIEEVPTAIKECL